MSTRIQNQLGAIRRNRGVAAVDLARLVDVSRQTIYAIEAGTYIPNTEVALKLARALEVPVEDIFALDAEAPAAPEALMTEVLSTAPVAKGQAVRVCQVGGRRISIPVNAAPYYLPEADGVISKLGRSAGEAELVAFAKEESHQKKIVLAGCDPAIGLVSRMMEKFGGVEIVAAASSSQQALNWLRDGKVHIAGSHLEDPETGEFNLPFIRREYPEEDFAVVTFARWEEGWVLAPGNPRKIASARDLARKGVRFVNRELGSGSRTLLDRVLSEEGIDAKRLTGYDRVAHGHLAAAYLVLTQEADCCLATRSAAHTFGLEFVPLQSERYDFVMRRSTLQTPVAQIFLDVLQRATLRRMLEVLAGYDTAQTGAILA